MNVECGGRHVSTVLSHVLHNLIICDVSHNYFYKAQGVS